MVLDPLGMFNGISNVEKPTEQEVEQVFSSADDIDEQVLSNFNYVVTEDLEETTFESISVGEVQQNESTKQIYSDATAQAKFKNEYIEAVAQLSVRMVYNKDNSTWSGEQVQVGDAKGEPLGPPDMEAIEGNIMNILRTYDSDLASTFADSEIKVDAAVSEAGGDAVFTLTKPQEGADPLNCTVNLKISWSDTRGWLVNIESVEGYEKPNENPQPPAENTAEPANNTTTEPPATNTQPNNPSSGGTSQGGSSGSNSNNPTMLLVCYSGDLVQVPGVIEFDTDHAFFSRQTT